MDGGGVAGLAAVRGGRGREEEEKSVVMIFSAPACVSSQHEGGKFLLSVGLGTIDLARA